MTPEQRDEVRENAERLVQNHKYGCANATDREMGFARAVLAYVPPADVQTPEGYALRRYVNGIDLINGASHGDCSDQGAPAAELTIDDAERLAWALLAAVAKAREKDVAP